MKIKTINSMNIMKKIKETSHNTCKREKGNFHNERSFNYSL